MQGKITTVHADGSETIQNYAGKVPLEDLQKCVGGYIETVPRFDRFHDEFCVAFCNEEGKLTGKPVNYPMTKLWAEQLGFVPDDVLCGPIVIVQGDAAFMRSL